MNDKNSRITLLLEMVSGSLGITVLLLGLIFLIPAGQILSDPLYGLENQIIWIGTALGLIILGLGLAIFCISFIKFNRKN